MYWGVNNSGDIGNEEGKLQKPIAVLATEKAMRIKTGKSMWMGFGLLDENSGLLDDKWKKCLWSLAFQQFLHYQIILK